MLFYAILRALKNDIWHTMQFVSKIPPASNPSTTNLYINYFIHPLSVLSFALQGKYHRKYKSLLAEQILAVVTKCYIKLDFKLTILPLCCNGETAANRSVCEDF